MKWIQTIIIPVVLVIVIMTSGCLLQNSGIEGIKTQTDPTGPTIITIEPLPTEYSLIMSSTPGIRLTPHISGFGSNDARYEWNTTSGTFLKGSSMIYEIDEYGNYVVPSATPVYWMMTSLFHSPQDVITITLIARDPKSGLELNRSQLMFEWKDETTVRLRM